MSHRTPWVHSHLPSDRIKPSPTTRSIPKNKGKVKQRERPESQKSPAVRKLDSLISKLQKESRRGNDPQGGCFCQGKCYWKDCVVLQGTPYLFLYSSARTHDLSPYTPICSHCGLILCSLNQPYYCCPHCSSLLLTEEGKHFLIERCQRELEEQISKEMEEERRLQEQARQAQSDFPLLGPNIPSRLGTPSQSTPAPAPQSRKVLSINAKTGKATVSSYTTPPRVITPPQSERTKENVPLQLPRVPPPAVKVNARGILDASRPWLDKQGTILAYVPDPQLSKDQTSRMSAKKSKKEDKEKIQ